MIDQCSPLHVSFSAGHGDGGIAFALSDLLSAQQDLNTFSRWLAADQYSRLSRNRLLTKQIINLDPTVVHLHGLWRNPTQIASKLSMHSIPYVIAPHGMLDPWALSHSSWKKYIAWRTWESTALNNASCIQALCQAELKAIFNKVRDVPVALIPNGVAIPTGIRYSKRHLPWFNIIPENDKVLLFLGRFHQKKGLEALMTAWQAIADKAKYYGWWMVFIGFGDDGRFQSQLKQSPVQNALAFGPVFNEIKNAVYQHSSAFILPSYSEGLPMAALEAMANRLPLLLSNACNLPEAFQEKAALEVQPEVDRLTDVLLKLFEMSNAELENYGINAYNLAKSKFSWSQVAQKTIQLYKWIDGQEAKPNFVQTYPLN